jgi:hypothetical protein
MDGFMLLNEKKAVGALIGFATGLFVASTLFTTFFSENHLTTNFFGGSVIFILFVVVAFFSFFGLYCMPNDNSKN